MWSNICIGTDSNTSTLKYTNDVLTYILTNKDGPKRLKVIHIHLQSSVFRTILDHTHQFVELSLEISLHHLLSICDLPSDAFPVLEILSLRMMDDYPYTNSVTLDPERTDPTQTHTPFSTAKHLREVSYLRSNPCYCLPHTPTLFLLPQSLVHFSAEMIPIFVIQIFDFLITFPALETCEFRVKHALTAPIIQHILHILHILHVHLKAISLYWESYELPDFVHMDWNSFFDQLTLPSLENLSVSSPITPHPITSLILRSRCSLKHLTICEGYSSHVDSTALNLLFDNLTSVTHYRATNWYYPLSAIRYIQNGALPSLVDGGFMAHPEGFGVFLDILDTNMALIPSQRRPIREFYVWCVRGDGFDEMRNRYNSCVEAYKTVLGLEIFVTFESLPID